MPVNRLPRNTLLTVLAVAIILGCLGVGIAVAQRFAVETRVHVVY